MLIKFFGLKKLMSDLPFCQVQFNIITPVPVCAEKNKAFLTSNMLMETLGMLQQMKMMTIVMRMAAILLSLLALDSSLLVLILLLEWARTR